MTGAASYPPRRGHPMALTVVVLMHGAAIGALALAKMDVITPEKIGPTIVDFIKEKKPDEPPPPERKVEPQPRRAETIVTRPPPIIDLPKPGPITEWKPVEPTPVPVPEPGPLVRLDPPAPPPSPPPPRKVEPARARANLASYVSDADYPASAIRAEEQGITAFRLEVGSDGRVRDCTVTGSSGSSALDSATCRLMKQRAKFTPARDSSGSATSDTVSSRIRWILPEG
jgi:periplasmic protein TonB